MQTRVLTLSVAAPRAAVFNFLADIEHLPAWTGGFCEWIELHREGWWAYTAAGELAVESKVDDIGGVIDLRLRHSRGWAMVIPLRVRSDGGEGVLVSVACHQPAGLSDDAYETMFDCLIGGLRQLADRFHADAVAA
jgi:hypothetical protein